MPLNKTIAQSGVAMAADIVDSVYAIFQLEDGYIVAIRSHGNPGSLKQVGLRGYISPIEHT